MHKKSSLKHVELLPMAFPFST